jgi:acetamidase/formamidase
MFGCGELTVPWGLPTGFAERAYQARGDRLRHLDQLDRTALDAVLEARARTPWPLAALGGVLGLFGALGTTLASSGGPSTIGRVHTLPSDERTVRLGVFDSRLPNVLEIDSGDVIVYPNTWSHFLNRLQPGVSIDDLARLRREHPGRGPHSIVGPVGVRGARPGDMLAIHFQRLRPVDWGATFVNPGDLGTGTLPDEFPVGQARYLSLDLGSMSAEFLPSVRVPLGPFQGTVATAPQAGGVVSSVPPGQHAGNIDLRELTEGSVLYIPVWQAGAKLFTGDSHAAQGDGEVNNQALESAMREVRVQVILHQQVPWTWPMAETATHWIVMGIDRDLNEAFRIATRNAIDLLARRTGMSRLDAYSLASLAVSFRVTQFVDQTRGIHAMIPKAIFSDDLRRRLTII